MYVSSSGVICIFSLNAFICFQLYCHLLSVYSVVPWFVFLSMFLSVSVNACITANIACICTSLYLCFSLTFCLWMCIPVSENIIIHSWCICTSLDPCFCLFFSSIFVYVCVRLYRDWLYVYRYVSYSAYFVCLSIPLSLSVSGYIIGNLHVCQQATSARSVCSSAAENICIIINSACIRTSLDSYFSLSLFGSECPFQCPDMLWLIVCAYVSLDHVCFSLSLWISVQVFGYIVTDCRCITDCLLIVFIFLFLSAYL